LSSVFDRGERQAAKRLIGMANVAVHPDPPLAVGSGDQADELARYLETPRVPTQPEARGADAGPPAVPTHDDSPSRSTTYRGPPKVCPIRFPQPGIAPQASTAQGSGSQPLGVDELVRLLAIHEGRSEVETPSARPSPSTPALTEASEARRLDLSGTLEAHENHHLSSVTWSRGTRSAARLTRRSTTILSAGVLFLGGSVPSSNSPNAELALDHTETIREGHERPRYKLTVEPFGPIGHSPEGPQKRWFSSEI